MEEVLIEAKWRFPIGTKFKSAFDGSRTDTIRAGFMIQENRIFTKDGEGECIYDNGRWAEIIEYIKTPDKIKELNYEIY